MRRLVLSVSIAALALAGVMTAGTAYARGGRGSSGAADQDFFFDDIFSEPAPKSSAAAPKKVRSGPGYCGTYKYWDGKARKCASATDKK
jgi:hypothetical protein